MQLVKNSCQHSIALANKNAELLCIVLFLKGLPANILISVQTKGFNLCNILNIIFEDVFTPYLKYK